MSLREVLGNPFPCGKSASLVSFLSSWLCPSKTSQALLSPTPPGVGAPAFAESSGLLAALVPFCRGGLGLSLEGPLRAAQTQASAVSLFAATSIFAGFCGPRRVLVYPGPGGAGREGSLNSPGYI